MTKIGVLVSGGGTNLQAILDRVGDGSLPGCEVGVVIASRPEAYALERAKNAGVPSVCIERKKFGDLSGFDDALIETLRMFYIDLAVTAGFLTIFGQKVVEAYPNRIINVHPSLIPSFCGKGFYGLAPHKKAIEYGVKITGATTHFVTLETDAGPIIMQKAVEVLQNDTPKTLQARVMVEAEQVILPESIKLFSQGRLQVFEHRVVILS